MYKRMKYIGCWAVILLLAAMVSCKGPRPKNEVTYAPVRYSSLPGWKHDDMSPALTAWQESCKVYLKMSGKSKIGNARVPLTVTQVQPACRAAMTIQKVNPRIARNYFEKWFYPVAIHAGDSREGLFTGYYEPKIQAKTKPDAEFNVPLYRVPDDLVVVNLGKIDPALSGKKFRGKYVKGQLRPYHSRAEINKGALANKNYELLWTNDHVDHFFLQVQGSGVAELEDGRNVRVAYAEQNGAPYTSIGKVLIDKGELEREEVTMQAIREWLEDNPHQQKSVLEKNESFVFFRLIGEDGPVGALTATLTPQRSLAVDRRYIPLGLPVFLAINVPTVQDPNQTRPFKQLMVAQDTGGAIKGPIRGDVFWGSGDHAELIAGYQKSRGSYWLLLPRI